jgi:hypothetical protein
MINCGVSGRPSHAVAGARGGASASRLHGSTGFMIRSAEVAQMTGW